MFMKKHRLLCTSFIFLFLAACSSSSDDTMAENDDNLMIDTPEMSAELSVDARIRSWTDTEVLIDYEITNTGTLELIVFDVEPEASTGIDDDGTVTLFKAKRDTGTTGFESPPTIAGRNISPEQILSGTGSREVPIEIDYPFRQEVNPQPEAINFCIGYGTADDIIPTTLVDGTYSLNRDLELQSLICSPLER